MSDPRDVAYVKKVAQEKHHQQTKSPAREKKSTKALPPAAAQNQSAETVASDIARAAPGELEKSLAVLSKLKDVEFHSRANIEALAELSLTIEDELKQKEFAEAGAIYSAQGNFHSKIAALIESDEAKCESLRPPAGDFAEIHRLLPSAFPNR